MAPGCLLINLPQATAWKITFWVSITSAEPSFLPKKLFLRSESISFKSTWQKFKKIEWMLDWLKMDWRNSIRGWIKKGVGDIVRRVLFERMESRCGKIESWVLKKVIKLGFLLIWMQEFWIFMLTRSRSEKRLTYRLIRTLE